MLKHALLASTIVMMLGDPVAVAAADNTELQQIRLEIQNLKESYEARIQVLEARLKQAEDTADEVRSLASKANEKAGHATVPPQATAPSNSNAFNPEISLILSGIYTNLSRDPANYRISGYIPSGEIGPGNRGFRLAESELGVYANIDPGFYGGFNLAVAPDNTLGVEEAFVQTIGLSHGLTVKAGRFFSGIGYLNEQHAHTWDFVDNPLAYQAFLGTQQNEDGIQVKWLAPTEIFFELGTEIGRGRKFPGSDRSKNGIGASTAFAHMGGDVGTNHSWRAGLSYLLTSPQGRQYTDTNLAGTSVTNIFNGNSKLWIADMVWKWAPGGNATYSNFKLQGEYFRRSENGDLTYDTAGAALSNPYSSSQSGWYLQGIYQFLPRWRIGLRRDQLSSGKIDYGLNNASLARPDFNPTKNSLMFDYNPSEFSRIRLQAAQDNSRQGNPDNQLFLQYQMSLGAHGAHQF